MPYRTFKLSKYTPGENLILKANLKADIITPLIELPERLCAVTQCFRSEAGSAGKDTTGMLRQH